MSMNCPKCGRNTQDDAVYCPYCGQGLVPSAKTTRVSVAGALLIVAGAASFIFLVLSIRALYMLYNWYPATVAETWILYAQMLTGFSFTGFLFGLISSSLALARRNYRLTMIFSLLCTASGAGAWIESMIIPLANLWYSFLLYFLPSFTTALIATILIYPRKAEFTHQTTPKQTA